MINTVVIEDEFYSRKLLIKLLTEYCDGVSVLGSADDVATGIELIRKTQPDLVFLDIEMSDGNGFDILNECQQLPFKVVFVTGYDHYAIRAIKYAALDYLVKPVSFVELRQVVQKFSYHQLQPLEQIKLLKQHICEKNSPFQTIVLALKDKKIALPISELLYVQAQGRQVKFVLERQNPIWAPQTLNHYMDLLPEDGFIRIHKSYLVNLSKVARFDNGRAGSLHLLNGEELPIAVRRKGELVERWQHFKS
jgi:Response regulator of the LytR/AlgR family